MRKIIYISVVWLLVVAPVTAQEKKYIYQDSTLLLDDDEQVHIIQAPAASYESQEEQFITDTTLYLNALVLPEDSVTRWNQEKAFAYKSYLDSMLRAQKNKVKEKQPDSPPPSSGGFLNSVFSSRVTAYVLWTLAGLFVLFIIYKLFLADTVFRKKEVKPETAAVEEELITVESDFDKMIRQAIAGGNYRLAVRYQYLRTLHTLADLQLIELAGDKTNYLYVQEIKNSQYRNDFAALTLNYEYVWYGEFSIDEPVYRRIETGFRDFNKNIDRT